LIERLYTGGVPMRIAVDEKTHRELWTAEEFLEWLEPEEFVELIEGERYLHSPVAFRHSGLLNFVDLLLAMYVETRGLGRLYREVVPVKLSPRNVFLPDLAFYTNKQLPRLGATHASEAPVLAVEAVSRSSARRDRGAKYLEYERAGVVEYWILDPDTLAHRFYRRQGEFLVEFASSEPVIRSQAVAGFWMRREWLNPDRLPKFVDVLPEVLR
jgi:Uma2 family endonuclease